ncbi:MAG: hypothetical protein V7K67_06270 [Nostoc sp.]|uniref:hypothetical protein n=1 Tax=Nostoc sp. TaxID=1180 RepID=UPI002FF212C3
MNFDKLIRISRIVLEPSAIALFKRMFEKSKLLLVLATRSRGYTDKTHLRGLGSLIFS